MNANLATLRVAILAFIRMAVSRNVMDRASIIASARQRLSHRALT